jgi:hypothetical protein
VDAKGVTCEDVSEILVDSVISIGLHKGHGISKLGERILASSMRNMLRGII